MIELSDKELKLKQIEILDYFASFCEKNEIKYWLCYGTLLGAVRHKGYIPWDDDIDLGMLRDDYDKLIKIFNDKNSNFGIISLENDKKFHLPFAKVYMNDTLVVDGEHSLGINIDIFPYDYVKDEKDAKRRHKREHIYAFLNYVRNDKTVPNYGLLKNALIKSIKTFVKCFSENYFIIKMNKENINNNKKICRMVDSFCETNYKGYITSPLDIDIYNELIKIEFENKFYYVPKNYSLVLSSLYGEDFMQLPPIEQRWHHKQKAYIK